MIVRAPEWILRIGAETSSFMATTWTHLVRIVMVAGVVPSVAAAAVATLTVVGLVITMATVKMVEVMVEMVSMAQSVVDMRVLSMPEFISMHTPHVAMPIGMLDGVPNTMLSCQGLCWDM